MTLRRHLSVFSRLAAARRRCWAESTQEAWGDQAETDQPDKVVPEQEEGSRGGWGVVGGGRESVSRHESGRGKREYICRHMCSTSAVLTPCTREGAGGGSRSGGGGGGGGDQSVLSGGGERESGGGQGGGEGEGRDSEGVCGDGGGGGKRIIGGGGGAESGGRQKGGEGEGRDSEGLRGVIRRYVALSLATQMHPKNTKVR